MHEQLHPYHVQNKTDLLVLFCCLSWRVTTAWKWTIKSIVPAPACPFLERQSENFLVSLVWALRCRITCRPQRGLKWPCRLSSFCGCRIGVCAKPGRHWPMGDEEMAAGFPEPGATCAVSGGSCSFCSLSKQRGGGNLVSALHQHR